MADTQNVSLYEAFSLADFAPMAKSYLRRETETVTKTETGIRKGSTKWNRMVREGLIKED